MSTSSTIQTINMSYKKDVYNFDYPDITESGCVEITPQHIKIQFPEIPQTFNDISQERFHENAVLFVNKKLVFSYQWLPIYTYNDLVKIKDMFLYCAQIIKSKIDLSETLCKQIRNYLSSSTEMFFESRARSLKLRMFENKWYTCIELDLIKTDPISTVLELPFSFELCIGSNIIFDSNSLIHLNITDIELYSVVYFILYKLSKTQY